MLVKVATIFFIIQLIYLGVMFMLKLTKFKHYTLNEINKVLVNLLILLIVFTLIVFFITLHIENKIDYRNKQLISKSEYLTKQENGYSNEELNLMVERYATYYKIPISIAKSIAIQESAWNHKAISKVQACGLFQIMPSTFIAYADADMNIFDPKHNAEVAMRYLNDLYSKHKSWNRALAIYNGGYKYANSKEAQLYVAQVLSRADYK